MSSITTTYETTYTGQHGQPSLLRRAWERIQYPAGPESRDRFQASRNTGYGW